MICHGPMESAIVLSIQLSKQAKLTYFGLLVGLGLYYFAVMIQAQFIWSILKYAFCG